MSSTQTNTNLLTWSFSNFNTLEDLVQALLADYHRKQVDLDNSYWAIRTDFNHFALTPGKVKAIRSLNKHYRQIRQRLLADVFAKLAAADLWAFEDPSYPTAANTSQAEDEDHVAPDTAVQIDSEPEVDSGHSKAHSQ